MKRNSERVVFVVTGVSALCASVFFIAGCPPTVITGPPDGGEPTGEQLFKLVTETDPFENWASFPGQDGILDSAAPHGPKVRVHINDTVEAVLAGVTGQLPDGSIIVKENLEESTSDKAMALTIMWKVSGFDPDNNDWFWAKITPAGVVDAEGKLEGCIGCHGQQRANDFIFRHNFTGN